MPAVEVPPGVVTMTSTVPLPGGLLTVICVPESELSIPATPPKLTMVASPRLVPWIATRVPPAAGPLAGEPPPVDPLAGDVPVTAGSVEGGEDVPCDGLGDPDVGPDCAVRLPGPVLWCPVRPTARAAPAATTTIAAAAAMTAFGLLRRCRRCSRCRTCLTCQMCRDSADGWDAGGAWGGGWAPWGCWARWRCSRPAPWTAGDPAEGHSSASSRAASLRCDRPRSFQSGP